MISINKISIDLGSKQIITDYSDQIPGASITVILGPNGSGKSTLLNAMAGDIKPTKGTITIQILHLPQHHNFLSCVQWQFKTRTTRWASLLNK
jgi:ABC-type cobalamin/Fe3+-siderophores transport system ATPase subunit